MKNLLLTIIATLFLIHSTAQTNTATGTGKSEDEVKIPSLVTTKFGKQYPNVNPTWTWDGIYYSARYTDASTNLGRNVSYDRNANIMYSDYEMEKTAYPQTITEYYTTNYPKEQYSVWWTKDADGNKTYYSKWGTGNTVWFDQNGKPIPEKEVKRYSNQKK